MYLKKLHISNFRCLRNYTIEFAPGVTILFGKNGSGKTTLIHAIHKALSFAFKNDKSDKNTIKMSLLNLGYLGWDDETAYSDLWITRLTKTWSMWSRAKQNVSDTEAALKTNKATSFVMADALDQYFGTK